MANNESPYWNAPRLFATFAGVGILIYLLLAGVGALIAIAKEGLSTTTWIADLMFWLSMAVGGIGIGGTGVFILIKIQEQAKKDPFLWLTPILSVAAGFVTDLCKELYSDQMILKAAFGGITALIFFGGSLFFQQSKVFFKLAGLFMFLLPPAFITAKVLFEAKAEGLPMGLAEINTSTWIGISALFLIGILIGGLSRSFGNRKSA